MTVEQELLEFCKVPRSIIELKDFLGVRNKKMVQARFTNPLMKQGKLKFIYPETPKSNLQRYLNSEVEITPELQETIHLLAKTERHLELEKKTLEFCTVPRTLGEIKEHIGLAGYDIVRKRAVQPLIDQGKIKLMYPHNPFYKMQKYVVPEWNFGFPAFTEDEILSYCETPKSKEEIKKHFAVGQDLLYKVLNPLISESKLVYTKSTRVGNTIIKKKLVKNEFMEMAELEHSKPTEEQILEFCKTPRFFYEIISEFGITDFTCRKIVNKLLSEERLAYTLEITHGHRKVIKNG